jgi:hypothetical protein
MEQLKKKKKILKYVKSMPTPVLLSSIETWTFKERTGIEFKL